MVFPMAALGAALLVPVGAGAREEPPARRLEGHRLRSAAVYLGTVSSVRRLGALEGLTAETQGRMEAQVAVRKVLRARPETTPPAEVAVFFDSRAPAPDGEGFLTLAPGEVVLVFADGFEPAYPREVLHGAPAALAAEVKALRDFAAAMDERTLGLHGLSPATRGSQLELYDDVLREIGRRPR